MKNKKQNVRTKINKSERLELRCTKAFKELLQEIAVQNNMKISTLIESICTDKIKDYFSDKSSPIVKSKKTKKPVSEKTLKQAPITSSEKGNKQNNYEREILRMMKEGLTPTKTAEWLNENGFKPQRGDQFTLSSVNSIRRRLKKNM
ncbi:hypothetical protein R3X26_18585 [Vibrio sp. TH_r3]|uniref:recombinase family protein n=1 Tax=Vibrio sp. TH_r3 TaxID=3082084 RepID=UPI002954F368|nr:recombinase family protein [Vibrio sp. TH_r3]MDV7106391.1 hypothetical protein [Vibrio sp. TH_r3]